MNRAVRRSLFSVGLLIGAALPGRAELAPPRLAVLISIDQCRADYLERFRPYFVADGFNRLLRDGAVFTDCHYRHAATNTSSGHATLVTGVHANVHGVIGNEWLLRDTLEMVGAVSDPTAPLVGPKPPTVRGAKDVVEGKLGVSPRRLMVPTVGDQLKQRYGDRSRIVSIATKNRSAALMGGQKADAVYWAERGRFVTSRFYRDALPAWVEEFNRTQSADKDFGREWDHLLEAKIYDEVQGPDNAKGEEASNFLGLVFPRRVDAGKPAITDAYYDAHRLSPFGMEQVMAFAEAAVREEKLGRHEGPDLFFLGISQLDFCGHAYGPDSHEVMDSVLRIDRALAHFFALLDDQVGAAAYTVVLTADHGVAPLPERAAGSAGNRAASRFDAGALNRAVEAAMTQEFGSPPEGAYWAVRDGMAYRFRRETLAAKKVETDRAARVAKAALERSAQVAQALTAAELSRTPAEGTSIPAGMARSFNAERSADVLFVLKPYVVDRAAGSNHGTPYDYDTHVPLVFYGAGVKGGRRTVFVGTDQLTPTLSKILGLAAPSQAKADALF